MDETVQRALGRAKRIYLTTYAVSGRAGTVPVWFMPKEGSLYFTTERASLKARRIQATGRARVAVGRTDGPAFDAHAEWIEGRPDLEREILDFYRSKYPIVVPLVMGGVIRRRLARKQNVVVRLTPV